MLIKVRIHQPFLASLPRNPMRLTHDRGYFGGTPPHLVGTPPTFLLRWLILISEPIVLIRWLTDWTRLLIDLIRQPIVLISKPIDWIGRLTDLTGQPTV